MHTDAHACTHTRTRACMHTHSLKHTFSAHLKKKTAFRASIGSWRKWFWKCSIILSPSLPYLATEVKWILQGYDFKEIMAVCWRKYTDGLHLLISCFLLHYCFAFTHSVYMLLRFLQRGQNRSKHRLGCVEKDKGSFILIKLTGTSNRYQRAEHWVLLKSQEKATENRTDTTIWRSVKGGEKTHIKAAP